MMESCRNAVQPKLDKSKIRLVICADTERGRTPYFDSNAIKLVEKSDTNDITTVPIHVWTKALFTAGQREKADCQHRQTRKYHFQKLGSDVKVLGEMMFGTVAMAFKGLTVKVHLLRSPPQLMVSNVFSPEMSNIDGSMDSEPYYNGLPYFTSDLSSGGHGSSMATSEDKNARSIPVDVPERELLSDHSTDEDSGFDCFSSSGSLRTSLPSPSNSSYSSLHRRWMRAQTTSLNGYHKKDKGLPYENSLTRPQRHKLAVGIIFGSTDEKDEECDELFQSFFFSHFALIEGHVDKLRCVVEKAYFNSRNFLPTVMEALDNFRNDIYDLFMAPRLLEPMWLTMTSSTTYKTILSERFMETFMWLVTNYNTKSCKFFVSSLLSAVLTHHLAWVATVTPADVAPTNTYLDKHTAQWIDSLTKSHPYNPLWAQLGDLLGAISYPRKISRTIVIGKKANIVKRILCVLSYFIRCSEVQENTDLQCLNNIVNDFQFETLLSQSPSGKTVNDGQEESLNMTKTSAELAISVNKNSRSVNEFSDHEDSERNSVFSETRLTDNSERNSVFSETRLTDNSERNSVFSETRLTDNSERNSVFSETRLRDIYSSSGSLNWSSKYTASPLLEPTVNLHKHLENQSKSYDSANFKGSCEQQSQEVTDFRYSANFKGSCEQQSQEVTDFRYSENNDFLQICESDKLSPVPNNSFCKSHNISRSLNSDISVSPLFYLNNNKIGNLRNYSFSSLKSLNQSNSFTSAEQMAMSELYIYAPSLSPCSVTSARILTPRKERACLARSAAHDTGHIPANLFPAVAEHALKLQPSSTSQVKSRLTQQLDENVHLGNYTDNKFMTSHAALPIFNAAENRKKVDSVARINLHKQNSHDSTLSSGNSITLSRNRSMPAEFNRRRHLSSSGSIDNEPFDPSIHCVEISIPDSLPESEQWHVQAFDRNFGHSLMADYTDHYMPDFVLLGTSDTNYKSRLLNDLQMSVRHSVLDEPIDEAVSVIADTDNWTVEVASSKVMGISPSGCTTWTSSQLVTNLIASVIEIFKLKMSAEFCLMHLEDKLQEIYFKGVMLSEKMRTSTNYSQKELTDILGCNSSDMPLLLAVAGTQLSSLVHGAQ